MTVSVEEVYFGENLANEGGVGCGCAVTNRQFLNLTTTRYLAVVRLPEWGISEEELSP